MNERRKSSADYTQLAKRIAKGSPQNMRLLEKALRLNPLNDQAHYELSIPYLYSGLYEKWNLHISKAIELNPEAWQGWRGYSKLFYFRDFGGALFDLDATDNLTIDKTDYIENMSVDFLRGLCYLGLKNHIKASEYFKRYILKESETIGNQFVDERAFIYGGIIYNYEKEYEKAIEYFDRAILYKPEIADASFHKSKSLLALGKAELAQVEIRKARKLFEDGKFMKGYYYEAIEQIYVSDLEQMEAQLVVK